MRVKFFIELFKIYLGSPIDVDELLCHDEIFALSKWIDNFFLHLIEWYLLTFRKKVLQILFANSFDLTQKLNEIAVKDIICKFHVAKYWNAFMN